MCKDNTGRILATLVKIIGDASVLVVKAITLREALRTVTDRNMEKILTESDS